MTLLDIKRRLPTKSERDDMSEYGRQFYTFANENPTDIEDKEEDTDVQPALTQPRRQRPLSSPRTPPHLKGSKLYKHRDPALASRSGNYKTKKNKAKSRKAPRYPITRSRGNTAISLHDRKGQIRFWPDDSRYVVLSFDKYLKDYVSPDFHPTLAASKL